MIDLSKEQMVDAAMCGTPVESSDFGPCRCGRLKLILGVSRTDYDYLPYEHGETVFWLSSIDENRDELMVEALRRLGCSLVTNPLRPACNEP